MEEERADGPQATLSLLRMWMPRLCLPRVLTAPSTAHTHVFPLPCSHEPQGSRLHPQLLPPVLRCGFLPWWALGWLLAAPNHFLWGFYSESG